MRVKDFVDGHISEYRAGNDVARSCCAPQRIHFPYLPFKVALPLPHRGQWGSPPLVSPLEEAKAETVTSLKLSRKYDGYRSYPRGRGYATEQSKSTTKGTL